MTTISSSAPAPEARTASQGTAAVRLRRSSTIPVVTANGMRLSSARSASPRRCSKSSDIWRLLVVGRCWSEQRDTKPRKAYAQLGFHRVLALAQHLRDLLNAEARIVVQRDRGTRLRRQGSHGIREHHAIQEWWVGGGRR